MMETGELKYLSVSVLIAMYVLCIAALAYDVFWADGWTVGAAGLFLLVVAYVVDVFANEDNSLRRLIEYFFVNDDPYHSISNKEVRPE